MSWAWTVWPAMGAVVIIPRTLNHFPDSDDKADRQLREAEENARKVRLKRAHERRKELEQE